MEKFEQVLSNFQLLSGWGKLEESKVLLALGKDPQKFVFL